MPGGRVLKSVRTRVYSVRHSPGDVARNDIEAQVEGNRIIIPVGSAHGVFKGSEFILLKEDTDSTLISQGSSRRALKATGFTLSVDKVGVFECSATIDADSLQLLRNYGHTVVPSRWSFGKKVLQVLVDNAFGPNFKGWLQDQLESKVASPVRVVGYNDNNRDEYSLRLERLGENDAKIWGLKWQTGDNHPVQPLDLKHENLKELAARAAPVLAHLARFQQIFALEPIGTNPPPFEVNLEPSENNTYNLATPYGFIFQNLSSEALHITVMILSPEFDIMQLYPTQNYESATVNPMSDTRFRFIIRLPRGPDWIKEALYHTSRQYVVRTLVTRDKRVAWNSLELPHIWEADLTGRQRQPSAKKQIAAECPSDWWVHDVQIAIASEVYTPTLLDEYISSNDTVTTRDSGYASGYASMPAMKIVGIDMPRNTGERAAAQSIMELVGEDISNTTTEYSHESSAKLLKRQRYIWELAENLCKEISLLDTDQKTQTRISVILPELLKAFALKVGYDAQTQINRDFMAFVYKYRWEIATAIMKICLKQDKEEDSNKSTGNADEMYSQDHMKLWLKNIQLVEQPEGLGLNTSSPMSPVENGQLTDEILTITSEPEDEEKSESWHLAYQDSFVNSHAYEWLRTRLQREINLVPTEPNTIQAIQDEIMSLLPPVNKIFSQSYCATFELDWDILDFFETQYSQQPEDVFEGVITLTGSGLDAQAATCAQYMKQTWPLVGEVTIQLIKGALRGGEGCSYQTKLPDGTILTAWINRPKFMVEAYGAASSIAETGEQLAWLGAALRTSPRQQGPICCVPAINDSALNSIPLYGSDLHRLSNHTTLKIKFEMEEVPKLPMATKGQCWHNFFRNPVIVKGYPIPQRGEWNTGLDIPLNIMAGLARTREVDRFKEDTYIKGFSTMLVPTKRINDTLCWHLIYKQDGSRISYLDDYVSQEQPIGWLDLESLRHILGWCSEAKFYAGSAEAYHPVTHSGLPKPHPECALAGTSVSVGRTITDGPVFNTGVKDTPVHVSRKGYVRRLKWISTKFILLWDERDKRGWLINGTSALLHVVRAFLAHAKDDAFRSAFCFKSEELQEAEQLYTVNSATEVLLNMNNRRLKLYEEDDDDGGYLLRTQIDYFYKIMEKLIDHQTDIAGHYGSNLNDKPRKYLEGWDFEDLVKECSPIYPRVATLAAAGKGWVDFIRSINAVTLVGRGFGDIIQPDDLGLCRHWTRVPCQRYYIASCVSDLGRLMKEAGSHPDGHALLSDNLIYYTPTPVDTPYKCTCTRRQMNCEPIQTLFPSSLSKSLLSRNPVKFEGSGAVIFGYHANFSWIWGDSGPPQQGKLLETDFISKLVEEVSDSGIGSSLESGLDGLVNSLSRSNSEHSTRPLKERHLQDEILDLRVPLDSKTYTRSHYTVGIICPLAKELKAVRALFDNRHNYTDIPSKDCNKYAFGDMAGHWVVATTLPAGEYGSNPAASVASNLRRSFSSLRFCLLVGIGGGVPLGKNDIRLGDVVVSQPTGTNPGVLQYDLGKEEDGDQFQRQGVLQRPPRVLTIAINFLQSDSEPPANQLGEYLRKIADYFPEYKHPGQELDNLSQAACAACATQQISLGSCPHSYQRVPRTTPMPTIHYGLIGSGNSLVKDAVFRDRLASEHGILCFEMEAAGVVNEVDCLVIRGISDYCDAQKNDVWQEYAAATAAAYSKLLLSVVTRAGDSDSGSVEENYESTRAKKRKLEETGFAIHRRAR